MKTAEFKKIISEAIDKEVEAYTFYRKTSEKAKDKNLKALFDELAGEEKKHREFLQGILAKDTSKLKFDSKADYKVTDAVPVPQLTPDLAPVEGLLIAIRRELEAMQMYTQLAAASKETEQQFLFSQLANMERSHKARLEDIYTEMAFPEVW